MEIELAQKAISAAIDCRWKDACDINEEILKFDPSNIDALNRLGRSYCELGIKNKALNCAKKVLNIDPINPIANKILKRIDQNILTNGHTTKNGGAHPSVFLEEPGKTKYVNLVNLAKAEIISQISPGMELFMSFHDHSVSANLEDGKYIGKLPDILAARLVKLSRDGYIYKAFIKKIEDSRVTLFIREIFRPEDDLPSFTIERNSSEDMPSKLQQATA